MSAISLPNRKTIRWPDWQQQLPPVRDELIAALKQQASIDPMRVFEQVYRRVESILIAAFCLSLSSLVLLHVYSLHDTVMTALTIMLTSGVWLFSAKRLASDDGSIFGLMTFFVGLMPSAIALTTLGQAPYNTFALWWNSAGLPLFSIALAIYLGLVICRMAINLIIAAFNASGPSDSIPDTTQQAIAWNRYQYRHAVRRCIRHAEPPEASRIRRRYRVIIVSVFVLGVSAECAALYLAIQSARFLDRIAVALSVAGAILIMVTLIGLLNGIAQYFQNQYAVYVGRENARRVIHVE